MRRRRDDRVKLLAALAVSLAGLAGCGGGAKLPEQATVGPQPELPAPEKSLIPTVHIAPAAHGWPQDRAPAPAAGFAVGAYATGLEHPRSLLVLPNGDVLVAETNAPKDRPDDSKGIKGKIFRMVQKRAGAGVTSPNRITLLRDGDGDGIAETRSVFLKGLNSPFGMALAGSQIYVADTDALLRFPYRAGETEISAPGVKVVDLPAGSINHHWTKDVIASRDGSRLYVTVGSNSNAAENGIDKEERRAAILEVDAATGRSRVFAFGLRNPNAPRWEPSTGRLWTVVNERDELGSDLVPDYLTSVADGAFYGWPYSYWGPNVDKRVNPQRPELVMKAIRPDFALGNHVAPLGLVFYEAKLFPAKYAGGAFIGEHGSWNRKPRSGYKVVFVPFSNGHPSGPPEDILAGFVDEHGKALGRPVGVAVDRSGALLVADDVGNTIWRVTPSAR
jgi:glucose/arabinose dehydrogenase